MKKQVLIAEDERIVAEDIKMKLEHVGYNVAGIASSGEESVQKAEKLHPDLALMDIVLEGKMDGIEAAGIIQSRLNIPVVYLTAYSDKKTLSRAKVTEPFGFIIKPFETKDLFTTIEMALYRHKIGNMLKESEERYKALFNRSMSYIFLHDINGQFLDANKAALKALGYKREDIPSLKFTSMLDESQLPQALKTLEEIIRTGRQKKPSEYRLRRQDGRYIWVETEGSLIYKEGKPCAIQGIARDITERRRTEEALRESKEQLRNLAAHLQSIREDERAVMAREIHDELGQALTAIKMDLSWLEKKIPEEQSLVLKKTRSMTELVDSTIQTVQRISSELRPGLLDDVGLLAAIEWQTEEFQKRTGIACELSVLSEDIILSQERSTAVFRIFQETLTNITRHAKATKVIVSLIKKGARLELKVNDNGKGITEEKIFDPKSLGLLGIQERVHFLEGNMTIKGIRNKGTTVTVTMPLTE
ncbi:MAG: PAS domain S-box protein [Candidatus Aminicenantes bacterium]|nr:PAS domain S-box protein [Candidatus Aminicenantes bacterium]